MSSKHPDNFKNFKDIIPDWFMVNGGEPDLKISSLTFEINIL